MTELKPTTNDGKGKNNLTTYYEDNQTTIHHGDCIEVMHNMPENSVDAIVTDPPYGLGFMGAKWDALPPGKEWAEECLRVLKPGGHLLAFGGTRTWHRLAVAIEDAGFEIRDSVMWLFGSGFPKSHDVGKAIDKGHGLTAERGREFQVWLRQHITPKQINEATGTDMGHHWTTHPTQPRIATADLFDKIRPHLPPVPERIERLVAERTGIEWTDYQARIVGERPAYGIGGSGILGGHAEGATMKITGDGTTEAAKQWSGWGTALKPAIEPIIMARKPFKGTVAANVLEHGTGAINIDGCRIAGEGALVRPAIQRDDNAVLGKGLGVGVQSEPSGRWPANVILDEHMAGVLDEQSGVLKSGGGVRNSNSRTVYGSDWSGDEAPRSFEANEGGASRFFYVAKAPKRERPEVNGVKHVTVKPLTLMRHLVRMVTPPNGTVLDPFAGSGTTIEAALLEGFQSIGIELTDEYLPLIQQRIQRQGK